MKRNRVTLDLHQRVAAVVALLLKRGLHGSSKTKVVEGLFLRALRDEMRPREPVNYCKKIGWCYTHDGVHTP